MGEYGYMDDAVFDIEADVLTLYLYSFNNETSESEKIEKLAKKFKLTQEKIASILGINKPNMSKFDYLKTLLTKELNGIYSVLARQGKTDINAELMSDIEKITIERNSANEYFDQIAEEILNFKANSEIENWKSFVLDFSTNYNNRDEISLKIKANIENYMNISGFYAIFHEDKCLYIGIGKRIWERIYSHYKSSQKEDKAKKWSDFFSKYKYNVKIYWLEFDKFENSKQSQKLREIIENTLEMRHKPLFEYPESIKPQNEI